MDDSNTIKNFTAADIAKYHSGQLTAGQMHAMEKAALEDPFLADALDGYAMTGTNVMADMEELRGRLSQKTEEAKVVPLKAVSGGGQRKFPWLRAAAVIIIIAGAGLLAQKIFVQKKGGNIASNDISVQQKREAIDNARNGNGNIAGIDTPGNAPTADRHANTATPGNVNSNTIGNNVISPDNDTYKKDVETIIPGSSTAIAPVRTEVKQVTSGDLKTTDDVVVSSPPSKQPGNVTGKVSGVEINPAIRRQVAADSITANRYLATENNKVEESRKLKPKKAFYDADGVKDEFEKEQNRQATAANGAGNMNTRAANGYINNQPANVFRGRVTDANNVGLPFARVMNPTDNNAGTYTDVRGYFTITYPDTAVSVQVRSVGFDNTNLQLRSNLATNQVTMQEDKSLAEVVLSNKKPNADRRRDAHMKLEEPEPLDGWDNYDTYIANNVEIPDELKSKPTASTSVVEISFEVNKYGEPVNIKVEKSLCSKCDAEAIRLVKEGPKWRRNAKKNGRTTVTISF